MAMQGHIMKARRNRLPADTSLDFENWLITQDGKLMSGSRVINDRWHYTATFDDSVPLSYKVTVTIRDRTTGTVVVGQDSGFDAAFSKAKSLAGMP